MSKKRKRNTYSLEFKAKVGPKAIHGLETVNEIGQAYGVHPGQVTQWKKAIVDRSGTIFAGKHGPRPVAEKYASDRLFGEIGRLTMELAAIAPGPHTSRPHPQRKVYPYLLRGVAIARPNQVWSTDIAYIRGARGFC